jgi:hypothetical protein
MICAATLYMIGQNAPSDPFVLHLDAKPTRESVETAIRDYLTEWHDTDPGFPLEIGEFDWETDCGHVRVPTEGGTCGDVMFVSFDPPDREALGR